MPVGRWRLHGESLLPRVPQIERLRESEVRVIHAGVGQQKRHRHDWREGIYFPGHDECHRDHGDDQHRVDRHLVGASLQIIIKIV